MDGFLNINYHDPWLAMGGHGRLRKLWGFRTLMISYKRRTTAKSSSKRGPQRQDFRAVLRFSPRQVNAGRAATNRASVATALTLVVHEVEDDVEVAGEAVAARRVATVTVVSKVAVAVAIATAVTAARRPCVCPYLLGSSSTFYSSCSSQSCSSRQDDGDHHHHHHSHRYVP